jgi:hypothetical protein
MITSQPRSLFARSIGFLIGRRHSTAAAQTAASQVSEQPWPQQAPSNEHLRFAPYFELAKAKKANDRFGA